MLACYFETASHYVAQAGLKLIILLLRPPERRCVPPQTAVDTVPKPGFLTDVGRFHSLSTATLMCRSWLLVQDSSAAWCLLQTGGLEVGLSILDL